MMQFIFRETNELFILGIYYSKSTNNLTTDIIISKGLSYLVVNIRDRTLISFVGTYTFMWIPSAYNDTSYLEQTDCGW